MSVTDDADTWSADAQPEQPRTTRTSVHRAADGDGQPHTSRTAATRGASSQHHDNGAGVVGTHGPETLAVVLHETTPVGLGDVHAGDGDGNGEDGAPHLRNDVPDLQLGGSDGLCGHASIQPQTPSVCQPQTAVVLFEGCGGATRGLHDAGYHTIGFDHWQPAVTCAQANGFDARLHDLSDPDGDHLVPYAPLWWASPPCQPFSAAGDGAGEFDGRDGFPWLLRLTALRLPDVLLIENVKGLTFAKHSAYFCAVLEGFRALGYEVDWRVLNCADLGVPQTRERCIIVCRRDGGPITWPMPTHTEIPGMFTAPWVTMAQALGWNDGEPYPTIATGHNDALGVGGTSSRAKVNGWAADNPRVMLDYRQTRPDGTGATEPILCDVTDRPAPTVGTQSGHQWMLWPHERPATTIAADNWVFQPGEQSQNAIRLTTPELAVLQGFPADWVWTGTKTQQARMIGNAAPPSLAAAVAAVNRPAALIESL